VATERQRITTEISKGILEGFGRSDRVEFCYPHTEIVHRPKEPRGSNASP